MRFLKQGDEMNYPMLLTIEAIDEEHIADICIRFLEYPYAYNKTIDIIESKANSNQSHNISQDTIIASYTDADIPLKETMLETLNKGGYLFDSTASFDEDNRNKFKIIKIPPDMPGINFPDITENTIMLIIYSKWYFYEADRIIKYLTEGILEK